MSHNVNIVNPDNLIFDAHRPHKSVLDPHLLGSTYKMCTALPRNKV